MKPLMIGSLTVILAMWLGLVGPVCGNVIQTKETSITNDRIFRMRDAVRYFVTEYGYPPPADPVKLLRILQGEMLDGYNWRKIVFLEIDQPETFLGFTTKRGALNAKGELIDGWGNPLVWDVRPTKGRLAIWSRLEDGKADREEAIRRNCYAVLVE